MADSTRLFAVDKQGTTYIGRPGRNIGAGSNPMLLNDVISVPTSRLADGNYKQNAMILYGNEDKEKEEEIRIDGLEKVTHFLE